MRGEMLEAAAVLRLVVGGADAGIAAARREPWPCLGRARPPKHEQHAGDVKSEQNDARLQRARGRGARAGERGRLIAVVHGQGAHQGRREGLRRRRRPPPRRGTPPRRPHQQRDDVVVLEHGRRQGAQLMRSPGQRCCRWRPGGSSGVPEARLRAATAVQVWLLAPLDAGWWPLLCGQTPRGGKKLSTEYSLLFPFSTRCWEQIH